MRTFRAHLRLLALTREDALTILDLPDDASPQDAKKRFRELTRSKHPDRVPEDQRSQANIEYKWITRAWDLLAGHEKPGVSEIHQWRSDVGLPSSHPRGQDSWKKIVLDLAKKLGLKTIKHTSPRGIGYGMELSDFVGILVYHFPGSWIGGGDWSVVMVSTSKWYPISSPQMDLKESQIAKAIKILIDEYIDDPDQFDARARGVPPKSKNIDPQSQKDITLIKSFPEWDDSDFLSSLVMVLERGDRMSQKGRNLLLLIERVYSLINKLKPLKGMKKIILQLSLILMTLRLGEIEDGDEEFVKRVEDDLAATNSKPKSKPPHKPTSKPTSNTESLKKLRALPEPKDIQRVQTILAKPDPIKEAKIQVKKIKVLAKALKRAKAAFDIFQRGKSTTALQVALIFLEHAMSLGYTP